MSEPSTAWLQDQIDRLGKRVSQLEERLSPTESTPTRQCEARGPFGFGGHSLCTHAKGHAGPHSWDTTSTVRTSSNPLDPDGVGEGWKLVREGRADAATDEVEYNPGDWGRVVGLHSEPVSSVSLRIRRRIEQAKAPSDDVIGEGWEWKVSGWAVQFRPIPTDLFGKRIDAIPQSHEFRRRLVPNVDTIKQGDYVVSAAGRELSVCPAEIGQVLVNLVGPFYRPIPTPAKEPVRKPRFRPISNGVYHNGLLFGHGDGDTQAEADAHAKQIADALNKGEATTAAERGEEG